MPSMRCKLGVHKWRNFGKKALVSWKEPGFLPGTKVNKRKYVFCERECLICGMKQRRKFSENIDDTLAIIGWENIEESESKHS